ncbi:uncharacterized protein BO95DRAFT_446303 [Aspergillus brunneoviolaceus CBS 621.78]|uniref:Uncharacterized protein n=1 Tax=Aspergillus brunneoviolaceus CBS 621.78 TaxID=1450534 RepID=A0ACD1FYU9_9EURO|nr:hypothetical protein BO95DRAFT_446303 [Aspergillus brunneoviolaceus CBS 621.78]RAH42145.1 hypothetical protein BO95DRAFT_446303 [Aspergillus brunneoviolaceus CBS 621.78]
MAILAKTSSLACFLIACLFFSSVIQALPVPGSNTPSGVSPMALAARSPVRSPVPNPTTPSLTYPSQ